ncbi:MAG TPA: hypothetical protein VMT96_00355 [Candidatus Bathyarchaeia archaeon]|nr:hypothetical protein [Candidatus Bathyarchaeia archaeon]
MYKFTNRKALIILAIIAVVIGFGIYLLAGNHQTKQGEPDRSHVNQGETVNPKSGQGTVPQLPVTAPGPAATPPTEEIINTAVKAKPYLQDANGHLTFGIVKITEPLPGWYVAKVRVQGAGELGDIILRETGVQSSPLTLVAGPATSFPPEYISLPDAIRKAL